MRLGSLVALIVLLCAAPASAAVTRLGSPTAPTGVVGGTHTFAVTVPTGGTGVALAVPFVIKDNDDVGCLMAPITATYGGTAMTLPPGAVKVSTETIVGLFVLASPTQGQSLNVVVTADPGCDWIEAGAQAYQGVSSSPVGATAIAGPLATQPTLTITPLTAGSMILDVWWDGVSTSQTAMGAGQTSIFSHASVADIDWVTASDEPVGAIQVITMSRTLNGNWQPIGAALELRAESGDATPPSVPQGLVCSAGSSEGITCTWSPSTDNVGIQRYRIERCQGAGCASFAEIAQPAVNSHSDVGLLAATLYRYRVRAEDTVGNLSAYGSTAEATTLAPRTVQVVWANGDNAQNPYNAATDTNTVERCSGTACVNFVALAACAGLAGNTTSCVDTTSPTTVAGYRVVALRAGATDQVSNVLYTSASASAVLAVGPISLTYAATIGAGNPSAQALTVQNTSGNPGMVWTAADDAAWLTCGPGSGTDTTVLSCSVDITGLASGTHLATITVSAPGATGSPDTTGVTLNLSPAAQPGPATGSSGRIR
jgi:hypothetical protein